MLILFIIFFIICLLIFLIHRYQETFMDCPDNYTQLCANTSYKSHSKSWCGEKSLHFPCNNVQNNYIQAHCVNPPSVDSGSYQTSFNVCNRPKEEFYY